MPGISKHRIQPILWFFTAVVLLLSFFAPATHAAEVTAEQSTVIQLTGRQAEGKYELTTKDLYLFSLENIAPGDSWQGNVTVDNDTSTDMAVSVYSITSTLKQDTALFDVLDLRIMAAGEEAYSGKYAAGGPMVTGYYLIPSGESLDFDIEVFFPGSAGNAYQGKQMDSTWTFDAIYFNENQMPDTSAPVYPSDPSDPFEDVVKTGMDLSHSNVAFFTCLFVFLASGCGLVMMSVRYYKARKAMQQWRSRGEALKKSNKEDA